MGDELGQVKHGFLADLLLVDGDPLADVSILQDARPAARHHEGRHIPQATARAPAAQRVAAE